MERKKRSWVSWGMALLLALNLLVPIGTVYAEGGTGTDKTSALTNVSVAVKQNGTEITGDTLPNADNLSIEVSFGVPVAGDYPAPATPVVKGDTADILLGKGFTLSAASGGAADCADALRQHRDRTGYGVQYGFR